jgi:hypothetical protein
MAVRLCLGCKDARTLDLKDGVFVGLRSYLGVWVVIQLQPS